jgi:hypothetical protein
VKFLAIEREKPGVSAAEFKPLLKPEAAKVWDLYKSDIIREVYFDAEKSSAILVLECSSKEETEGYLAELPLVEKGLISFDLYSLTPYPGFSRLMEETGTY